MKFLLVGINAKYIHSNPAIYSLKAYAGEEYGRHIEIREYTINHRKEEIVSDIYVRKPDAIGFSCYIWNYTLILEILTDLQKLLPDTDIWLGGPEVSFEGEEVLNKLPMVTGIMAGEGEETFRQLLICYINADRKKQAGETVFTADKDREEIFKEINGLILRGGKTAERELLPMNSLPFLYGNLEDFTDRILYYEASRGCPYRCSYCLSSVDKTVRFRDLSLVKKEILFFLDSKVPQVKFIDRTFNCNHDRAMEIWQHIKENDNGVTNFHFEIAADIMTEEEILVLTEMRPGLVQLEIGVQSVNEKTLREINRFADIKCLENTVRKLHAKKNIHIHLDLIAGLPYEDYESFRQSFDRVYNMEPEQLQLGFLKVLKGSPMFTLAEKYGLVYQTLPPYEVLYTNWLSYDEVLKLKQIEEMVELYYNSNQFVQTLSVLLKNFDGAFAMFEALAEFYEKKGYFLRMPARSYRYQILLDFACETEKEKTELYRELLTCDFYLRENARSRPSFCRNLSDYYQQISEFYQKEEKEPAFLLEYRSYHARQMMKMTHMEVFNYAVWEEDVTGKMQKREKPALVLFDYQKKDALTGNAKMTVVESSQSTNIENQETIYYKNK